MFKLKIFLNNVNKILLKDFLFIREFFKYLSNIFIF